MGWTDSFSNLGNEIADSFTSAFTDRVGGEASLGSSGPIGTYFWTNSFREFLYSFHEVVANDNNWKLNPGYSLKVIDKSSVNVIPAFGEFRLPVNPSNIQMNREFAISFKPTQNGIVTEHSGTVFQEFVIQGTTGLMAQNNGIRADELIYSHGNVIDRINNLTTPSGAVEYIAGNINGLTGKKSGYTWAHLLENYIASYAQAKTLVGCQGLVLVFCNKKDGTEWQCEPVSIDITRTSQRPFLYDYRLVLRVLRRNVPEYSSGLLNDVIGYINGVENIIINAGALINGADEVLTENVNILYQVESVVDITILRPLRDLAAGITNLRRTGNKFPSTQRKILEEYKETVEQFESNFYDFIDAKKDNNIDPEYEEVQIMKSLIDVKRAINQMTATNALYASDKIDPAITTVSLENNTIFSDLNTISNMKSRAASKDKIIEAFDGGLKLNTPAAIETVIVRRNETLEDIAYRTQGNVDMWIDIAILNDLVYPYIDETVALTNNKVKKAGDVLLVPSAKRRNALVTGFKYRETNITSGMSPTEKFMGVDFKLTKDYDLAFTNSEDFELTAGVTNAAQALDIKLALEKGELKHHPNVGVGLVVGNKSILNVNEIADNIRNSILSDERFESIANMAIIRIGGAYKVEMTVKVVDVDYPIPLTILV